LVFRVAFPKIQPLRIWHRNGGPTALIAYLPQAQFADSFSTDNNFVYWTYGGLGANSGSIRKAPLAGAATTAPTDVLLGLNRPFSLASPTSGPEAGSLFWLEDTGTTTLLKRRWVDGTVTTVLTGGPAECLFHSFDVRYGFIFTEQNKQIVSVSINGGPVTVTIASDPGRAGSMLAMTADDTHVYWATTNGRILRVAKSIVPGAPTTLTTQTVGNNIALTWVRRSAEGLPPVTSSKREQRQD
jgi:hypothetical protein